MARAIDADRLCRELASLSHGGGEWTYQGMKMLIDRQPTITQPNEPLTLEQLREMDGEPVYVILYGIEPLKMWALVEIVSAECVVLTNNLIGRLAYYSQEDLDNESITIYRRNPDVPNE